MKKEKRFRDLESDSSDEELKRLKIWSDAKAGGAKAPEKKEKGSPHPHRRTLYIALPASILSNVQTDELRTYVVGQIARAAAIYRVCEIVVFEERSASGSEASSSLDMFVHLLRYLECPQYLRRQLFPFHPFLRFASLVNPLGTSHHFKAEDDTTYREGAVVSSEAGKGSLIEIGLKKKCVVKEVIDIDTRVTVHLDSNKKNKIKGRVVSPRVASSATNSYWGYEVRRADSFSEVFNDCVFKRDDQSATYDVIIGTSERGDDYRTLSFPKMFKHCLICFGGLGGLETSIESDERLDKGVESLRDMFGYFINICPNQGTNTIRTEEAVLISLAALSSRLLRKI